MICQSQIIPTDSAEEAFSCGKTATINIHAGGGGVADGSCLLTVTQLEISDGAGLEGGLSPRLGIVFSAMRTTISRTEIDLRSTKQVTKETKPIEAGFDMQILKPLDISSSTARLTVRLKKLPGSRVLWIEDGVVLELTRDSSGRPKTE